MNAPIRRMLILGGGSEIAVAFAQRCIDQGLDRLVLAGRPGGTVDHAASTLLDADSDASIAVASYDGSAPTTHASALKAIDEMHGPFDTVLIAFGRLGDEFTLDVDPAEAADLIGVNFAGAASSTLAAIPVLQGQLDARLIVISSIAAVRPRIGNLAYGAAKAGLDAFLTELRAPMADRGISLTIVRPGFVHSRMTDGLDPAPFATTPDVVAQDMHTGLMAGKKIVHSPSALAPVGQVLRNLPGPVWRKVSAR